MSGKTAALTGLLAQLRDRKYHFVTPTPTTHKRVLARANKKLAQDLRDVFGWSLPFKPELLDAGLLAALREADVLEQSGGQMRSRVRVSSLDEDLFLHSAYPTEARDSVFFGPDSYRFARFLYETLPNLGRRRHIVDIGAGSGVGAIAATRAIAAERTSLTDINPLALELARANWAGAGLGSADFVLGDGLSAVMGEIDLIIANPPYIADPAKRAYRDGGAMHGGQLSVQWAEAAARRLQAGGVFVLYTGSAIIGGQDRLKAALLEQLADFEVLYGELDPDVFGEELERADYAEVDRIAVVGLVAVKN